MSTPAPMMAVARDHLPPDDANWSYEMKWDGVRVVADVTTERVRLTGRSGADMTVQYPELAGLSAAVGDMRVVLDGEVVILGPDGRPSFEALGPRIHVRSPEKARELARATPVTYIVFDVLDIGGTSTLPLPLHRRRELLDGLDLTGLRWQVSPAIVGGGADLLKASREMGLEGIVAKKLTSPYRPGRRSEEWIKIKNLRTQEVVIGGYTVGEGGRAATFGALLLGLPATPEPAAGPSAPGGVDGLAYAGSVGTGFDTAALRELTALLRERTASASPFTGPIDPRHIRAARWVRPDLVGEVAFAHWTTDGRMRHPTWRGLRPDKLPSQVIRE